MNYEFEDGSLIKLNETELTDVEIACFYALTDLFEGNFLKDVTNADIKDQCLYFYETDQELFYAYNYKDDPSETCESDWAVEKMYFYGSNYTFTSCGGRSSELSTFDIQDSGTLKLTGRELIRKIRKEKVLGRYNNGCLPGDTRSRCVDDLYSILDCWASTQADTYNCSDEDLSAILNNFDFENARLVELITTFKPRDPEQLSKPQKLKTFFDFFQDKYPSTEVKVHVDNALHAKVYISSSDECSEMIISSANFTHNGLLNNNEIGYWVDSDEEISSVIEDLYSNIDYLEVTRLQVERAMMFADQYAREHPEWALQSPSPDSDILSSVYSSEDSSNETPKYFLKPIGTSEEPVTIASERDFSALHQNLHFSKKKPKGLRKGDVVITTAVGAGLILSYFKVTGSLNHVTDEEVSREEWKERWPWYLEGKTKLKALLKNGGDMVCIARFC